MKKKFNRSIKSKMEFEFKAEIDFMIFADFVILY